MLGPNDSADAIRRTDDHDFRAVKGSAAVRPGICDRVRAGQLASPSLLSLEPSRNLASTANRVVVVDDHPIFLQGLSICLRRQGTGVVSGQTSAAAPISCPAMVWLTDVILAGCERTEDLDGDFFQRLHCAYLGAEALVVLDACNAEVVERLLKAGAMGCISRDKGIQEFAEAIAVVGRGEIYVEKKIALELVTKWVRCPASATTRSRLCCA